MRAASLSGKTRLSLLVSVLALVLTVAGAASAQTLKVWITASNDDVHHLLDTEWIPAFEAANPGVTVEWEKVGWSALNDRLVVAFAAGAAPDIIQGGAEYRAVYAENGFARPIDDFLEDWPEWQNYVPGAWETVVWNGKTYGIPAITSPRTIVYNKRVFEEVGLPPEPPTTWEDFRTTALRLNREDADGMFIRVGFEARKYAAGLHFVLPFLLQNGVEMLSPDGREAAFNTPEAAEALEFLADLSQNVSPIPRTQLLGSDVGANFAEGKSGMMYGNAGVFNSVRQIDPNLLPDVGVAPPLTRKEQVGITFTDWWAVTTHSQHPKLAFDFITFMSDPDRLAVYNELVKAIPPRNDALSASWMDANPELALFATNVLPYSAAYFSSQHAHQMNDIFFRVLSPVMDGYMSPNEALERAAADYNALFK